jgi:hypothetical protein
MARPVYAESRMKSINAIDRLGENLAEHLVIEDPDRPMSPDAEPDPDGSARIVRDDPELMEVRTQSAAPCYLVLADTFDPGWSATIDGKPAPIRPAWLTFRAVFLPAGAHTVEFRYRPAGLETGIAISMAGVVASVLVIGWRRGLPAMTSIHSPLDWPERWPWFGLIAIVCLVGLSSIYVDVRGKVSLSDRWTATMHQFTWGAGIEAMKEQRR